MKLLLIDGNSLMFRAYYATLNSGEKETMDGIPTHGVRLFANFINTAVDRYEPTHMLVAFDAHGKTFRDNIVDYYKDGRSETPEGLIIQTPICKEYLEHRGIPWVAMPGWEADDVIGTAAEQHKDADITILSSDKDLIQLVTENVKYDRLLSGMSVMEEYRFDNIKEKTQFDLDKFVYGKALMGDTGDNIPGVRGVGEKTAIKLLDEYDDIEDIYKNIDNIKGSLQKNLIEGKWDAFISYKLALIDKFAPIQIAAEHIELDFNEDISEFYDKYEIVDLLRD